MTDNMKRFLEEVEKDAAFAERLGGADSPETVLALAKEKGFTLTAEDLTPEEATGELSDDELDDVAGGLNLNGLFVTKIWEGLSRLFQLGNGGRSRAGAIDLGSTQGPPKDALFRLGNSATRLDDLVYRGDGSNGPKITNL